MAGIPWNRRGKVLVVTVALRAQNTTSAVRKMARIMSRRDVLAWQIDQARDLRTGGQVSVPDIRLMGEQMRVSPIATLRDFRSAIRDVQNELGELDMAVAARDWPAVHRKGHAVMVKAQSLRGVVHRMAGVQDMGGQTIRT